MTIVIRLLIHTVSDINPFSVRPSVFCVLFVMTARRNSRGGDENFFWVAEYFQKDPIPRSFKKANGSYVLCLVSFVKHEPM